MRNKIFTLFSMMLLLCTARIVAQPLGWAYSLPITLTNTTGALVTDYQVKLTLDTQTPISAAEMLANGDDMRFGKNCSGTTLFNYWIESGINTPSTIVWVKLDTLPATGSVTIYMFYGNSGATPASSLPAVFNGPNSSTDSVSGASTGGVTNSQRGFRFSSDEDILVTSFGKNEPTGTTRYVTLFDFSSQAILDQIQVAGPAAQYSYGDLPNPIWLTAGTQYVLEIYQDVSDGYYYGAAPQVGEHITYYDMRYCNSCSQTTFPTNTLGGMHYGYVDFWYYTKKNIASLPTITYNYPAPVNTTSGVDLTICSGNSTTLSASGLNTISWYDAPTGGTYLGGGSSFTTPSLSASTTYYIQDSSYCSISARTAVTVTVNPLPAVSVSGAAAVCLGASTTMTAMGADTYAWTSGPATDVYTVSPLSSTTYTVVGTDATTGCSNTATQLITVNQANIVLNCLSPSSIECEGSVDTLVVSGALTYSWSTLETTDTIVVTHTLSSPLSWDVVGTDGNGCMDTATYSFASISALLPVSVDLNAMDTLCANGGLSALATATPAGGSWSGTGVSGNDFDPMVAGAGTHVITYTVSNADNCMSSGRDSIYVSALLPVSVDLSAMDTMCINAAITTLSSATPSGGTWSGTGVTGSSFDPSAAGVGSHVITYTVMNVDNCSSLASASIYVSGCVGVNELTNGLFMNVYPNPSTGAFVVETSQDGVYSVVNSLGQTVYTFESSNENKHTVRIDSLPSGIYFVVGTNGTQLVKEKIVVTR